MDLENTIWQQIFNKKDDIVSRKIAGETILVPIRGKLADMQKIFSLNPVAEYIWKQLDGKKLLGDIRAMLLERYDVDETDLDTDIREFIEEMLKEELIAGVS